MIVGAGLAGAKTAEALRTEGFEGDVVLVGEEPERPYDRPPLSKGYLLGSAEHDDIFVHPEGFYAEHDIELRLGTPVASIDRIDHQVVMEGGERIAYDKAVLATGSSPRRLSVPGADLEGVRYLRRVGDSEAIKSEYSRAKSVVVIGAGWIGLETASAARAAGAEVSLIEVAELPLLKVLGPELGKIYAAIHSDQGVSLHMGVGVESITGDDGHLSGVALSDGTHLDADVVVVGVGITPNTGLAAEAGLHVEDGVVVDEHMATVDPDFYAVGDVASSYYPALGCHLRLEHWSAADSQGAVAAANMVGKPAAYEKVPYFFSDQYEVGMEYTGHAPAYDRVVLGTWPGGSSSPSG